MDEIYNVISYYNLLVYSYYDMETKTYGQYVVSKNNNDIKDIIIRLGKLENQIGFGNLSKDYYALHHIIESRDFLKDMPYDTICERVYNYIKQVQTQIIPPTAFTSRYMTQFDLCNFWGFQSGNKNFTLTDIKIAMNIYDVTENPSVWKVEDNDIEKYQIEGQCNVKAIVKLYNISIGATNEEKYKDINTISARYKLCQEYNLPGVNDTPTVFAQRCFQKLHKDNNGKNVVTLLTERNNNSSTICLSQCIPGYAIYESDVFNRLVTTLCSTVVSEKSSFNYSTGYNGILLKFGVGGVHGCVEPGKYESDENHIIVDVDISSMYASIATSLGIKPRHTDYAFVKTMSDILKKRFECLSKTDEISKGKANILKQVLNIIYGKTKEDSNMFYDPKYSLDITIAAQLFMAKFLEMLRKRIDHVKFLMVNTDSITFVMNKNQQAELRQIYLDLKKIIGNLRFKIRSYDIIYIKDVNNYIGKSSDKIVTKGIFDYNLDLYKDNSAKIIPYAVMKYLFENQSIDDSIDEATFMDFAFKAKSNEGVLFYHYVEPGGLGTVKTLIQNPSRFVYTKDYKTSGKIVAKKNNTVSILTDIYPVTLFNTFSVNSKINDMYYRTAIEDILSDFQYSNGVIKFQ